MKKLLLPALTLAIFTLSCSKTEKPTEIPVVTTGLFVLNEGSFNGNNTTLTYYNIASNTASTDYYNAANGNGLGDTGNDLLLYGGKIYIVMNVSSYVQVADASTAKAIKRINFETADGAKKQPRYAAGHNGKVFVTSYDGTVAVIDTASLNVEKWIEVGTNPDGLVVSGNKLYVSNSGGLTPGFDSTISVIDLSTLTELQKIKVGTNPGAITADNNGNVYVACGGNYFDINPSLVKVSTSSNTVSFTADTVVGKIKFHDGYLFTTGGYSGSPYVRALSLTDFSQQSSNFVTDGTTIKTPYGLHFDAANGDVFITDAKDFVASGEVFCFDKTGKKRYSFSTNPGLNPNSVVIIKQPI